MYEYQYGKGAKNLLELIALSKQQQAQQSQQAEAEESPFSGAANLAGRQAGRYGAKKVLGALGFGGGGSAAVTTQGAAGYEATAAALPELFGGGSAAASSAPIMSQAPQGGGFLSSLFGGGSSASAASSTAAAPPASGGLASLAPSGAAVASVLGPIGAVLIAGKAVHELTKNRKSRDAEQRDRAQDRFIDLGIVDKDYKTPTGIDIARDLSGQAGFPGMRDYDIFNKEDGTPVDPLVPYLINRVSPIATHIAVGNEKQGSDTTGMLVKAVLAAKPKNEAEADAALKNVFANLNIGKGDIAKQIQASGGGMSDEDIALRNFRGEAPGWQGQPISAPFGQKLPWEVRGLADEALAKKFGVKFNPKGVSREEFINRVAGLDRYKGVANLLTKEQQEAALASLQNANYLRE